MSALEYVSYKFFDVGSEISQHVIRHFGQQKTVMAHLQTL